MFRTLGIAGIVLLAAAADGEAQACLGLPTMPGQIALQGIYDSGELDTGYLARAVFRTPWSFGIGASYRHDEYERLDTSGETFGAVIGVEVLPTTSICLVTEPSYSMVDFPAGFELPAADVETLRFPALVGAGQRLDFSSFFLVPSARGGFVYFRTTADPGTGVVTEETNTEVMIDASLAAGSGNAFANLGINVMSGQDTRPRFLIGVGYMLR